MAEAVRELEQAASTSLLQAHLRAARGALAGLRGRYDEAEVEFGRAEALARQVDAPWVLFQVAWYRAAFAARRGEDAVAKREASVAHALASAHHWSGRQRRVETEFRTLLGLRVTESSRGMASMLGAARQLEALLEVEEASTRVLDPDALSSIVLDEVVRILGAQRAFLFLGTEESDALRCYAGRDSAGEDLPEPVDFSRTVIEEAWHSGKPLVLKSTADGELLGAQSIVAHDLRSVMAAPLHVHGRRFGVVYVDTRLAEGMFTESDAAILSAIARHIPMAIENARAARLEVQVESERQRRALADQLRRLTASIGSTLEVSEVLGRLLDGIESVVGFDRATAWIGSDSSSWTRVERGHTEAPNKRMDPELWSELRKAARAIAHPASDARRFYLWVGRTELAQWMVIPLGGREGVTGVLVLETDDESRWKPESLELARTFTSHASAAIENASLFQTVQRLATIDGLTGTANRRFFFERAEQELQRSLRYGYDLTALMLDVDYFKAVNDTHGHAVGDAVLERVAEVCRACVRELDLVGRYGGEEFAILLPHTDTASAKVVAERLRRQIAAQEISTSSGSIRVTVSIGLATRDPAASTLGALLQCADAALYGSKRGGRDRVTVWSGRAAQG